MFLIEGSVSGAVCLYSKFTAAVGVFGLPARRAREVDSFGAVDDGSLGCRGAKRGGFVSKRDLSLLQTKHLQFLKRNHLWVVWTSASMKQQGAGVVSDLGVLMFLQKLPFLPNVGIYHIHCFILDVLTWFVFVLFLPLPVAFF